MKTLRFSFEHPVKGKLRFRPLAEQMNTSICRRFNTGAGTDLTVSLKDLAAGSWELTLEWEHDERSYQHQQRFEVAGLTDSLFKLSKYAEASLFHSPHPLQA